MIGRQGFGWRTQVAWGDVEVMGVFHPGAVGQDQATGAPPGKDPPQQRRGAERDGQLGLAVSRPVAAVVEPFSEVLAQAVPSAPGREGRGFGVQAGSCQPGWPRRPTAPGRSTVDERGEVNAFQAFLHLVGFSRKAHCGSAASGRVTTKMLGSGAPSQVKRSLDFRRYLPLSGREGRVSYRHLTCTAGPGVRSFELGGRDSRNTESAKSRDGRCPAEVTAASCPACFR